MTKPTAPSTPEPQGEKCAHAPEIPEREQVFMRTGLIRVMYDAGKMDDYPARERESRKQAEAALQWLIDSPLVPYFIKDFAASALLKPVQEPAERERGK